MLYRINLLWKFCNDYGKNYVNIFFIIYFLDVPNDVQHSEDEMKVEEVSGEEEQRLEAQEDKREERTAEPLIEEPQEVVMKEEEEVDGPVDQTETEPDSKDKVEISDVTEKEQPVEVTAIFFFNNLPFSVIML